MDSNPTANAIFLSRQAKPGSQIHLNADRQLEDTEVLIWFICDIELEHGWEERRRDDVSICHKLSHGQSLIFLVQQFT